MRAKSFRQMSVVLLLNTFLITNALAQGVVWFDNRPAYLPSPPDRTIRMPDGSPITGTAPGATVSQYYAQLYYQNNAGAWVAHPTVARFFTSAANAGFWNGGSRTLVNAGSPAAGVTRPVQLQIVVWDGGTGTATTPQFTFDQARQQGRLWAASRVFTYIEEWDSPRGTDDTYMKSFVGGMMLPGPSAVLLRRSGSELRFYVEAYSPSQEIVIETRTNLTSAPWFPIQTNVGSVWFTNTVSLSDSQRYYRAKFMPP